jgi:hypothetical protein
MAQEDERVEKRRNANLSVVPRFVPLFDRESVWNRNFCWQILAFTTIILGGGYYFIFINSPIKPARYLPRIPKSYGNRWQTEPAYSPSEPDDAEAPSESLDYEQEDLPGAKDNPNEMTNPSKPKKENASQDSEAT